MATEGLSGIAQSAADLEELIFDSEANAGIRITTLCVRCRGTGAADMIIRIPALHGTTSGIDTRGALILRGEREYFRVSDQGIRVAYANGLGGIATIDWYAVAVVNTQGD